MQLQFMRFATHERKVPDSLCLPLIRCRMQGKRTDYCKVRMENKKIRFKLFCFFKWCRSLDAIIGYHGICFGSEVQQSFMHPRRPRGS